jgi:hypothetical protein
MTRESTHFPPHTAIPPPPPHTPHLTTFAPRTHAHTHSYAHAHVRRDSACLTPTRTYTTAGTSLEKKQPSNRAARNQDVAFRTLLCRHSVAMLLASSLQQLARVAYVLPSCVAFLCVLSHWVHAAIVEVPDLPSLKCSSYWSLGLYPASVDVLPSCVALLCFVFYFLVVVYVCRFQH